MTEEPDILVKLRRYADDIRANGERSELDDAADEIERLTAGIARLNELFALQWDATQSAETKAVRAEIERLHQAWSADHDAWVNDNKRLQALLRRHHLRGAHWDSDLAEETRAALEPKP